MRASGTPKKVRELRADQLLLEKGLVKSRTQGQKLIREGKVFLRVAETWRRVKKASLDLDLHCEFRIKPNDEQRFVSRAGLKLHAAFEYLNYSAVDKCVLDIGQSTGGFSDCVIQAGAKKVVGVDVGHNQLAQTLKANPNIVSREGINARTLSPEHLSSDLNPPRFDLVVMDVSFISQTLILPRISAFLADGGDVISLVKPQFEVGPSGLGKGGLVKNESLYPEVRKKLCKAAETCGFQVNNYFESAIQGGDGNREFFLYASFSS